MKTASFLASALLPFLAAAQDSCPSPPPPPPPPNPYFTVISAHSASPVHLLPMNAAGNAFYLGGSSQTYCPSTVGSACPPPNGETAFTVNNPTGTCSLDVEVPGGQQVFVGPDGALSFTTAHSAYIPPGSLETGFHYQPGVNGAPGHFSPPGSGFLACPVTGGAGPWQVFVDVPGLKVPEGNLSACYGFDALTEPFTGPTPVWQFT